MPSLTEIAEGILADAKRIDAALSSQNLAPTSFDHDTLSSLPHDLDPIRKSLVDSTQALKRLTLGPVAHQLEICFGAADVLAFQAIYHFRIPQCVPLDGEISYKDIAAKCSEKLDEGRLRRFVQMAIVNNIFQEKREGYVSHTAASRALVEMPGLWDLMGMNFMDMCPVLSHMIPAIEAFGPSEEPTKTAFQIAYKTSNDLYTEFSQTPERVRRFGGAMMFLNSQNDFDVKHLVKGYDWSQFSGSSIVDIGGGHGQVSQALGAAYPHTKFIVEDSPETIKQAEGMLAANPAKNGNVSFMPHDFFKPQPVEGAAVYFFRWILHNWSDKYCVEILRNLIPALKKGSRVILYENLLTHKANSSWSEKGYPGARNLDLFMMAGWNSKERSAKEFQDLFALADPRFRFVGTTTPPSSSLSLIEAIWE